MSYAARAGLAREAGHLSRGADKAMGSEATINSGQSPSASYLGWAPVPKIGVNSASMKPL